VQVTMLFTLACVSAQVWGGGGSVSACGRSSWRNGATCPDISPYNDESPHAGLLWLNRAPVLATGRALPDPFQLPSYQPKIHFA
jgi:hypothetical protein